MKGDFVVVRSVSGPLLRRVEEIQGRIVFISSPEQHDLRAKGLPALDPVGFPREHVFHYDAKLEKDIARGKVQWERLTPYKAKSEGSGQA
jgi:hypothetical protein